MNPSPIAAPALTSQLGNGSVPEGQLTTRQAFQDFVAGTFYTQMLKALRSTQGEVQYLGGGQAQEIFRNQLDQETASQLARDHGGEFAEPLFDSFQYSLERQQLAKSAQLDHFA